MDGSFSAIRFATTTFYSRARRRSQSLRRHHHHRSDLRNHRLFNLFIWGNYWSSRWLSLSSLCFDPQSDNRIVQRGYRTRTSV